jgi:hypothetical protein
MRHLIVAIVGLVLGVAAAAGVLYVNPLADKSAPPPNPAARVLSYSLPDHVLGFSVGEDARLLGQDTGDDSLWEETIDRAAVLGLVLNGADSRPAAIASTLLAASSETDLLRNGVLVSEHWLVTIPGEGTVFVHANSNAWPLLKETLVPVWYFDRPFEAPAEYWPTVGPNSDDSARVIGLTGSLRGSEGSAVERYELAALDRQRRLALAKGELHLNLAGPQVAAE